MKYAIVGQTRMEAIKGGKGSCPSCNSELIAKCGDMNINHWAHKGTRNCDTWWENETEWHRSWKNKFPKEWQEIVHFSDSGEKHIADVKTTHDWIVEFQHSYLKPTERNSRNSFYKKLVWVVDGLRRKTDRTQFENILKASSRAPIGNVNIRKVNFPEESRLLREWMNSRVPVFFDFHDVNKTILWFLLPISLNGEAYLLPFSREEFVTTLNQKGFDELVFKLIPNIENIILEHSRAASSRVSNSIFQQSSRTSARRRRF